MENGCGNACRMQVPQNWPWYLDQAGVCVNCGSAPFAGPSIYYIYIIYVCGVVKYDRLDMDSANAHD